MKKLKIFLMIFLFSLVIGFSSCSGCQAEQQEITKDTTEIVAKAELSVEHLIATNRQDMYTNYAEDYRWFETCIVLKDYLDEECDGSIVGVSNIFQAIEEKENGTDVFVVMFTATQDTSSVETVHTFWIEDNPLNDEAITINFKAAFDKLMEANCPKPHSKHVVLRKQVGPVAANPQWIFGNQQSQVYVDATTGEVRTSNPVFPEQKGFKMPLGEWP